MITATTNETGTAAMLADHGDAERRDLFPDAGNVGDREECAVHEGTDNDQHNEDRQQCGFADQRDRCRASAAPLEHGFHLGSSAVGDCGGARVRWLGHGGPCLPASGWVSVRLAGPSAGPASAGPASAGPASAGSAPVPLLPLLVPWPAGS